MVTIQVKNAAPADVDSVSLSIRKAGETGSVHFALFDDGAAMHENDEDVVARDGIFSQRISWQANVQQRTEFIFRFEASDRQNRQSEPLEVTVVSLTNSPPEITGITMPDSLPSGFDGLRYIKVTATDSNEVDDIVQVNYNGLRNDTTFFQGTLKDDGLSGDEMAGDGVFSISVDRTFAAGKKGWYELQFEAKDKSAANSARQGRQLLIRNAPPQIFNLIAPTEAQRPAAGGSNNFLVKISVEDPQGPGDIKFVGFMSLKPDSTYANSGQPIPMVDNGLPFDLSRWSQQYFGDTVAGDGVFSITAFISPTDKLGDYVWTFSAIDFAGNESEKITHTVKIK